MQNFSTSTHQILKLENIERENDDNIEKLSKLY